MNIRRFSSREERLAGLTPLHGGGGGPILYSEHGIHYQSLTQGHTLVLGRSGAGKTTSVTQTTVCGELAAGRSVVVLDAKGTVYEATRGFAEQGGYPCVCLDLSCPQSSPHTHNPLRVIYENLASADPLRVSWACEDIFEFGEAIVPTDEKDPYWHDSAVELICGVIHTVCALGQADEVNLVSVMRTLTEGNIQVAQSTNFKQLFAFLEDSLAKRYLTTYANAPHNTALSMFSVANTSVERLVSSPLMERFLGAESFRLSELDLQRPFIIYIIVPDETTSVYPLAAVILAQIVRHLLRAARHQYHGTLPVPCTVIVEELGSMGRCIPQLPELLSSARSRGIAMLLCMQSLRQLDMIYGEARAAIIRDNSETLLAFAGKDPAGLEQLAASAGGFSVRTHGGVIRRPVVTAERLAAMEVGQVFVQRPSGIQYITRLPRFDAVYRLPPSGPETAHPRAPYRVFSLDEYIRRRRKEQLDSLLGKNSFPPLLEDLSSDDAKKRAVPKEPPFNASWRRNDEELPAKAEEEKESDLDEADFSVLLEMKEQYLRRRGKRDRREE